MKSNSPMMKKKEELRKKKCIGSAYQIKKKIVGSTNQLTVNQLVKKQVAFAYKSTYKS